MELKPPLSFEGQIINLKSKNLIIEDESQAIAYLTENNYYHLNKYFHDFMDENGNFVLGTSFTQFITINENDKFLRNAIFRLVDPIELKLRTVISNYLSLNFGSNCFYNSELSENIKYWGGNYTTIINCVLRDCSHPVVNWHLRHYGGQFPVWVILEFATFNALSKYFKNLKSEISNEIGRYYYQGTKSYILSSWFQSIGLIRNKCAHGSHLFRERHAFIPKLPNYINLPDPLRNSGLFTIMYVMKYISKPEEWNDCVSLIDRRDKEHKFMDGNYGFPNNWREYLLPD